jgi:DNA-binding SARP family transcriptional activator/pimeloyl-ACP methyl ester carboxylesterase
MSSPTSDRTIRYRVLGPLALDGPEGSRLSFESKKQRLLLALVLAAVGRTVLRERLIEALWDDDPPADPRGALQTHVSRLRRLLSEAGAEGALTTEPGGYRLRVGTDEIDAARFETLVQEARELDAVAALERLRAAFGLWHGSPFQGVEASGVRSEAVRLEEVRTRARELEAESLLAVDRPSEAIERLETLVAEDPLRERPRALLMEALYRNGRQAEALDVYQDLRRVLSEELGLEPSPGLREVELRILRHELPSGGSTVVGRAEVTPAAAELEAEISYVGLEDGTRLAVGQVGDGPPLVALPAFVSSLTAVFRGDDPRSALFSALADRFRLVTWDRAGTGLSAAGREPLPVEDPAEVPAVLDALGLERVPLLGISAGGPTAIAAAARHPARVSHLVLVGTFADGPATFAKPEVMASMVGLVRAHWGMGSKVLTDLMSPAASPELARRAARFQRDSAPADVAARVLKSMYDASVVDLLPRVEAPTLVLHYTRDPAIPFRGGQGLAAGVAGARLVPLHGYSHLPTEADRQRVIELIARHLAG